MKMETCNQDIYMTRAFHCYIQQHFYVLFFTVFKEVFFKESNNCYKIKWKPVINTKDQHMLINNTKNMQKFRNNLEKTIWSAESYEFSTHVHFIKCIHSNPRKRHSSFKTLQKGISFKHTYIPNKLFQIISKTLHNLLTSLQPSGNTLSRAAHECIFVSGF